MSNRFKRVLLIVPPAITSPIRGNLSANPPLGLAYIAAVLEKNGYQVKILDAITEGWWSEEKINNKFIRVGLPFLEIKRQIIDFNPDVVGVSCLFSVQYKEAHYICKLAKVVNKRSITVMGGAHPSAVPEETLKDANVDFVVIGEGEYTFLNLLESIENNKDLNVMDGIAFRSNNYIKVIPKTKFITDLDSLPFPARHLLPMEKYFKINKFHGCPAKAIRSTSIITSRGCPADCVFCSIHTIWGKQFRARSPENIITEIKHLKIAYDIKELDFEDDNLTFDRNRAIKIFDRMIKENLKIIWRTPNGVAAWCMDDELLKKMKMAGCYIITFGVESGNQTILKNIIKKPLSLNLVAPLVRLAKKLGIQVCALFVIGFPGETLEQIKDTFQFAKSLNVYCDFQFAMPFPGTELYNICVQERFLSKDFNYENLMHCGERATDWPLINTPYWNTKQLKYFFEKEYCLLRAEYFFKRPISLLKQSLKKPHRVFSGILRFFNSSI